MKACRFEKSLLIDLNHPHESLQTCAKPLSFGSTAFLLHQESSFSFLTSLRIPSDIFSSLVKAELQWKSRRKFVPTMIWKLMRGKLVIFFSFWTKDSYWPYDQILLPWHHGILQPDRVYESQTFPA